MTLRTNVNNMVKNSFLSVKSVFSSLKLCALESIFSQRIQFTENAKAIFYF